MLEMEYVANRQLWKTRLPNHAHYNIVCAAEDYFPLISPREVHYFRLSMVNCLVVISHTSEASSDAVL